MIDTRRTWSDHTDPGRCTTADDALRTLDEACAWTRAAKRISDEIAAADADRRLRVAVEAARDAGIAWGPIADRIGIARGNAYQRYRKRSV